MTIRISVDLWSDWNAIEHAFHRTAGEQSSFVRFLVLNLFETWLPFLESWEDPWKDTYQRDRNTCTSPTCERHDVTPHHVQFRAHGGSDDLSNMTTLCSWCHLEGVHRGRIQVRGKSQALDWGLGREPVVSVRGRKKVRA